MDKDKEQMNELQNSYGSDDSGIWSSSFSIEDVEDFQTEFTSLFYKTNQTQGNRLMSMLMGGQVGMKKKAWHLPNENNFNKRFVRVTISTQDDATIFVIITKPKYPEYYIFNNTEVPIEYN